MTPIPLTIGGKTATQLLADLKSAGINISTYAQSMVESPDFTTLPEKEKINLVRITVGDMFDDKNNHTMNQIYAQAIKVGYDLCPAEVAPHYRLQYTDQPINEWIYVGMKPLAGPGGSPRVFKVARYAAGTWLYGFSAHPADGWLPHSQFLFRLRKSETKALAAPLAL